MVHRAQPKGKQKAIRLAGPRTERERSGAGRAGYVPQSRSYESNVRRGLRKKPRARRRMERPVETADQQLKDAHRLARRGARGTRVKRSSTFDQKASYYRGSRGSAAGGFIEGRLGQTAVRARRGGAGDQNRRTQSVANVRKKRSGAGPGRYRQSDQGDAGQ